MIPAGEVLKKVGYKEQEKQLSEFATEIPAQEFTKPQEDLITKTLRKHKTGDVLEILIKESGSELIKPYGFILDNAGNTVTINEIISRFGINTTASVRCSECHIGFTWSEILFHLTKGYKHGHDLTLRQITKLFSEKWYDWIQHNGKFIK